MKIYNFINEKFEKKEYLHNALKLNIHKKNIISFVGAGGKTSIIYELAKELGLLKKKVIVTTTTHMFMPEEHVITTGKKKDIEMMLCNTNIVTVGMISKDKKIKGVENDLAKELINICDAVLVEADGCKRLPLKVPASYEPVILEGTNIVVGVAGIDALGQKVDKVCHRPNLALKYFNLENNHIIKSSDMAKILLSDYGQKKGVNCEYRVVINKVDTGKLLDDAYNICKELKTNGIDEILVTTFR